jgi:hypothetical protein
MPYFGPTGHWRCSIAPVLLFYRNDGAIHLEPEGGVDAPEVAMVARYTGAAGSHYFEWDDAGADTARSLADKFIDRLPLLCMNSQGWDYPYATSTEEHPVLPVPPPGTLQRDYEG